MHRDTNGLSMDPHEVLTRSHGWMGMQVRAKDSVVDSGHALDPEGQGMDECQRRVLHLQPVRMLTPMLLPLFRALPAIALCLGAISSGVQAASPSPSEPTSGSDPANVWSCTDATGVSVWFMGLATDTPYCGDLYRAVALPGGHEEWRFEDNVPTHWTDDQAICQYSSTGGRAVVVGVDESQAGPYSQPRAEAACLQLRPGLTIVPTGFWVSTPGVSVTQLGPDTVEVSSATPGDLLAIQEIGSQEFQLRLTGTFNDDGPREGLGCATFDRLYAAVVNDDGRVVIERMSAKTSDGPLPPPTVLGQGRLTAAEVQVQLWIACRWTGQEVIISAGVGPRPIVRVSESIPTLVRVPGFLHIAVLGHVAADMTLTVEDLGLVRMWMDEEE